MITTYSLKVIGLVCPIITAIVTVVRLGERYRTGRFGYDDGFAALSLTILVAFVIALLIHVGDPTNQSRFSRFALYYTLAEGFYGILWTARLSILFTIIRISPTGSTLKRLLYMVSVSYFVIWLILSAQLFWVCEPMPSWKDAPVPQCPLDDQVPIAQLISDVYADAILIAAPLKLLWSFNGSVGQRRRLIIAFSASIVTTVTSLVHSYYIVTKPGTPVVLFTAVIEISSSLFVCNLAVLFGVVSRLLDTYVLRNMEKTTIQSAGTASSLKTLSGYATTFPTQSPSPGPGTLDGPAHLGNTAIKLHSHDGTIGSVPYSKA